LRINGLRTQWAVVVDAAVQLERVLAMRERFLDLRKREPGVLRRREFLADQRAKDRFSTRRILPRQRDLLRGEGELLRAEIRPGATSSSR
jgi:hypothetical protein